MDALWMHEAYRRTRKGGAPGIDGVRAKDYAEELESNLANLLVQAKSGSYRAPAVRRVQIPKGDGRSRALGIPTFEDKVLQRAVLMLLEPVYEQDFYDFNFGFRPRLSAQDALNALRKGIYGLVFRRPMQPCWVLDCDIEAFFDRIPHEKLREVLGQRVDDGVIRRLVGKWLKAGILEDGERRHLYAGTPQGGVLSPLLANLYLHHVLDEWWAEVVQPLLEGDSLMVRYADDFVMAFTCRSDAEKVQLVLSKRLAKYGLKLNPEKTRLLAFHVPSRRRPKPEAFTMLGFTLHWGKTRKGQWAVKTRTSAKSMARGLSRLREKLKRKRHASLREQANYLRRHLKGHYNYFARAGERCLRSYLWQARGLWRKWLSRRSQKGRISWKHMQKLLRRHKLPLPPAWKAKAKRPRQYRLANI